MSSLSSKKPATVPFSASIVRWKQANQVHPPKITAKHKPTHSQLIASKEATSNSSPHSKASRSNKHHIHSPRQPTSALPLPFSSQSQHTRHSHSSPQVHSQSSSPKPFHSLSFPLQPEHKKAQGSQSKPPPAEPTKHSPTFITTSKQGSKEASTRSKKEPGEGSEEGSLEVKPQGSSRARQRSDDAESTGTRSSPLRRRPAPRHYNPSPDRTQPGRQSTISPQPIRNSTVEP